VIRINLRTLSFVVYLCDRTHTKVLGIHIGRDSSAALVVDGRIVTDVAEERFVRIKHYCGLPICSLDYCLRSQNIGIGGVDLVAVSGASENIDLNFLLDLKESRRNKRSLPDQAEDAIRQFLNRPCASRRFTSNGSHCLVRRQSSTLSTTLHTRPALTIPVAHRADS